MSGVAVMEWSGWAKGTASTKVLRQELVWRNNKEASAGKLEGVTGG